MMLGWRAGNWVGWKWVSGLTKGRDSRARPQIPPTEPHAIYNTITGIFFRVGCSNDLLAFELIGLARLIFENIATSAPTFEY